MNFYGLLNILIPFLLPIVIGYCLARWMKLNSSSLLTLVRCIFLPIILYNALAGRLSINTFLFVALSGACVAIVGNLIARYGNRVVKAEISTSSALPNVAYFTIPFFALIMGTQGLGTACAFFVGAALTCLFMQSKLKIYKIIWKEPWIYAAIIGMFFASNNYRPELLDKGLNPLIKASYPMILIYLGAYLYPLRGIQGLNQFVTVGARLLIGFVVALLAIKILPISRVVSKALMLAALAPPSTLGQIFGLSSDSESNHSASKLGIIVSFILITIILSAGWKPWNL
jgi:predicted permease